MSLQLGTKERSLRVAIIGSGPSGFYAAETLLKSENSVIIDIFERLPVPFGLVRFGVAPDHAKIKNVIRIYEKVLENENVSLLANVTVGVDIGVEELQKYYDVLLFTCGAETDRKLGIPGEDLIGSHTATEFVAWYNGHPDYKDRLFDLSGEVAVIIGQGNVAIDVCRILSKTIDELKTSDIAQHALDALAKSNIKEVHMVGRRGPAQAAFTPVEIREFGNLSSSKPIVNPEDLNISETSQKELEDPKNAPKKKNFEILKSFVEKSNEDKPKKFVLHFHESPVELKGDGCLQTVVLEENELIGEPGKQKAKGTGKTKELNCSLLFRSVGYRGIPIEGVPFDEDWGIFSNKDGRIVDENSTVVKGFYCSGWIKRGPSGVIGTNKKDSDETVAHILEDINQLTACPEPDSDKVLAFLKAKNIRVIRFEDWKKIDAAEIANGQKVGKPREKFVDIEEMLKIL